MQQQKILVQQLSLCLEILRPTMGIIISYPENHPRPIIHHTDLIFQEEFQPGGFPMAYSVPIISMEYKKGVNFASAGSGILDTSGKDVITLNQQLDEFKRVAGNITSQLGSKPSVDEFFAKALFLFSVGSNDLFAAHFTAIPMNNDAQRDQIIKPIIKKFKDQLMVLYKLGARKFGVIGSGQVGCVPAARTSNKCNENLNALSLRFKEAAKALFKDLSTSLNGFKYSFGDSHVLGSSIERNPTSFGLKDLSSPCCSTLTTSFLCTPKSKLCANPEQHYYWDGFHPTQAAYKLVAKTFIYGSLEFNTPFNLIKLVQS